MMDSDAFLSDFNDFVSADTVGVASDFAHLNKDDALLTMNMDDDVIGDVTEVSFEAAGTTDNQPDHFFDTSSAFSSSLMTHVEQEVNVMTDINDISDELNLSTSGGSLSKELVPGSVTGMITDEDDQAMMQTSLPINPVGMTRNVLIDSFEEDSAPCTVLPVAVQQTIDDEDEWDDFEEADVSPNIDAVSLSTPVISTDAVDFKEHSSSSTSASSNLGQSYVGTLNARNNDHFKEAEFLLGDADASSTNEVKHKHKHMALLYIISMIGIDDIAFY